MQSILHPEATLSRYGREESIVNLWRFDSMMNSFVFHRTISRRKTNGNRKYTGAIDVGA